MAISSEDQTKLLKVVVGLFNAAPGQVFLPQLETPIENGLSVQGLAAVLVTKSAFTDGVMGSATTSAEQAEILAGNFGLTADGVAGSPATQAIDFFTAGIDNGANIGNLVYNAVVFLERTDLPAEFEPTATLLANKALAAGIYSESFGGTDLTELQTALSEVTGDAPYTEADAIAALKAAGVVFPSTFALTAAADSLTEGSSLIYTVTASEPVTEDTEVVFTLVADDSAAADQGTNSTNLNDFAAGAFNPVTVIIPAGGTTATFSVTAANDGATELPEDFSVQAVVGGETLTVTSSVVDSSVQTFTLTIGEDNLTGTSGSDLFNAPIIEQSGGGTAETLENIDVVDGGDGTDTMNATLDGGSPAPNISGVEIINVRDVGGSTFDMANVSGAEQVWNKGSNDVTLTIDNIGSTDITFGVMNTDADTDLIFDNAEVDGTSDELKLALNNAGDAVITADDDLLTGNVFEAVSLTVTGENVADITGVGAAVESLTIDGAGEVELAVDATALTTLDATGMTAAGLDIDISAASSTELSAKTGAGDDRVLIDGTLLVAANDMIEIDLGDGSNTLALANITDDTTLGTLVFTEASIAGVNVVELTDAIILAADGTLELDGLGDGVTGLVFGGAVDLATFDLEVSNAPEALDVTFEDTLDDSAGNGNLNFGDAVTVVINSESTVGATNTIGIDGTSGVLKDLTLNAEDDADYAVTGDATDGSITTLTVADVADTPDSLISVALTDTVDLTNIVLSGGEETGIDIDASLAAFGGTITINIGSIGVDDEGTLTNGVTYVADGTGSVREIFEFTGENIGDIEITDYEAGVGGTADRLDFSEFAAITGLDDLSITFAGGNTTISANDSQFDGTITVIGVDLSTDAFNFIF